MAKRWQNRPEGSNWGEFGDDDQIGRFNLLTDERRREAAKEIREGKLAFPKEPRALYVLSGKGYDSATGKVVDGVVRWVIYVPNATAESTGLSTTSKRGEPWLMDSGTLGAHIMITPK